MISESATQTEAGVRGVGTPLRGKPVVQPMPPGVRAPPGLREPPGSVPPTQPRRMPFIYPVPPKSEGTPARGGRMPDGFTPPSGPATQALVEWVNVKTGERWTAPSGGYTPPNEDWVPAGGGTVAPVQTTGPGKLRLGRDASPYPGFGGARAPGRMQPLRRDVEN